MLTQPAGKDHSLKDYSSSKMIQIILRVYTTLVIGWIILFMGVKSVNISVVDFTTESTDAFTPHSLTSVIMDLRITNRVYNDSLADQHSEEYTTLKQEVDQLFADIYAQSYNSTHLIYLGTDEMIFSNGSVIATSRLLFGPTQVNPELVRGIFSPVYKQIPSPALEIDLNYIDNELPTEEPFEGQHFSRPPTTTYTQAPFTTTPSVTTPTASTPDTMMVTESLTRRPPATHTPNVSSAVTVGNITQLNSTPSASTTSMLPNTTTNSPIHNTTLSAASNSTTNGVTNGTTTEVSSENTLNAPNGTPTETTNSTTTTAPSRTTTTASKSITTTTDAITTTPTSKISTTTNKLTSIHSTVVNPTVSSTTFPTVKTSPVNYSPIVVAAPVPGWAVALLALAGVSLFLLIILIILVVIWCCFPKRRVFVNEPDEMNPPMYFNPDIPMYSTQSTFDTANGKQTDVREKPPKNRTGMYVVNK